MKTKLEELLPEWQPPTVGSDEGVTMPLADLLQRLGIKWSPPIGQCSRRERKKAVRRLQSQIRRKLTTQTIQR